MLPCVLYFDFSLTRVKHMVKECVCSQEADVEKLEKKINCGQIEEVIFQVGL